MDSSRSITAMTTLEEGRSMERNATESGTMRNACSYMNRDLPITDSHYRNEDSLQAPQTRRAPIHEFNFEEPTTETPVSNYSITKFQLETESC